VCKLCEHRDKPKKLQKTVILFIFIFPLTIILLVLWLVTRKKIFGKVLGYFWLSLFGTCYSWDNYSLPNGQESSGEKKLLWRVYC
jgi:hypothetical protein